MKHISEYFMVTGRRVDNGEIIIGNVITDGDSRYITTPGICTGTSRNGSINKNFVEVFAHRVDPETVERVAVKVKRINDEILCPNCDMNVNFTFDGEALANYCVWCGQRLEW